MSVEPNRRRIGIHVKTITREAGNVRARQFTAERQHQSIVGQELPAAGRCDGHPLFREIDCLDPGGQMVDADRIEHLAERDSDLAKVDLVIPDSNVVIGVTVDNQNLDLAWEGADLVKFARRADGGP